MGAGKTIAKSILSAVSGGTKGFLTEKDRQRKYANEKLKMVPAPVRTAKWYKDAPDDDKAAFAESSSLTKPILVDYSGGVVTKKSLNPPTGPKDSTGDKKWRGFNDIATSGLKKELGREPTKDEVFERATALEKESNLTGYKKDEAVRARKRADKKKRNKDKPWYGQEQ